MTANLALDDKLIEEAVTLGNHKTKTAAVTTALLEYVQKHKQMEIINHFGTVDFDPDYDYKTQRKRT